MKVLVTGGAGFIGSNIVKILERKGVKVLVLDDFSHADYKNLDDSKADIICADIIDGEIFKKLPKVDGVIHEAAITDTTLADDEKMMAVNYTGSKNILNFCLKNKIRLTYASSAGVYGEAKPPSKEDQKLTPHNMYAYSKCTFDSLARKYMKQKATPPIIGLRYFNVYGPLEYHKGSSASMIYQLYLQMKENKHPRVFKYGEQKRDFIYVKDVAAISVKAFESEKSAILNVGTGKARSFNDIISVLNKVLKKDLKPDYFDNPYKDKYQNYTQADATLLKKTLKTEAKFSLESGITDYVRNHLSV
jgi:ADP-L-glycero-D-manno-heptose 6-epimerase